jgi:hypothetical protein
MQKMQQIKERLYGVATQITKAVNDLNSIKEFEDWAKSVLVEIILICLPKF